MGPQNNVCSAQSYDSTGTSRVGFWGSWGSFFPSFSLGRPSQGKGISLTSEDRVVFGPGSGASSPASLRAVKKN